MAYQEQNIPARPSPRAPPPPRAIATPPPPHYYGQKTEKEKKIKTVKQLKRSQVKTLIVMIVFVVFLIIIAYFSMVFHTFEDKKTMNRDTDIYWYSFQVPEIMSQDIPTQIEVESSEFTETNILFERDYNEDLSIIEIRNLSINENHEKKNNYIFEEYLEPGKYVIVSYVRDNENDIELDYKISRYYLLPFLLPISLLIMIPIVICIIWIVVLQRRKSNAPLDEYGPEYGQDDYYQNGYDYYGGEPAPMSYNSYAPQEHYPPGPPAQHGQPPGSGPIPRQRPNDPTIDFHGSYASAPPAQHSTSPRPPRAPRAPHRGAYPGPTGMPPGDGTQPQYRRAAGRPNDIYSTNNGPEVKTTTVPCKCGEIIVISDPTRPLRIKCPRCGRRGILEGKKASAEDGIFY